MKNYHYQSAANTIADLAAGKVSSVQLVEAAIERINSLDQDINAVVVKDFDNALTTARTADEAFARGERLPLLGLPMTVKESFHVTGLTTTWGNPAFRHWRAQQDGLVISRLKSAGAVIIGKTNVPYMLGDWQTYNEIYGTTNNPWNVHLTAGGSSGGSAAAVAMGYVSLELGSDLAGSLRVPAHFCGICTHKPSSDLVPMRGNGPPTMPMTTSRVDLAVLGPMARSAADLAIALEVIAGPDELSDGVGYKLSLPPAKFKDFKDVRVLLLDEHPLYPTSKDILKAHNNLYEQLIAAGVRVQRTLPSSVNLEEIACNYALLLAAWFSINVPQAEYAKEFSRIKKILPEDQSLAANFSRGITMQHRDWIVATRTREKLRQQWCSLYAEFDLVLCPVMPTPAFPHDHEPVHELRQIAIDGIPVSYSHMYIWCSMATLFGLPATVIPIALTENSLPVGIQIIGDYLQDNTTIEFARLLEKQIGGFITPPNEM